MQWYLAKLVYQIICGEGHHTPQFDEQLRLIEADDSLHAFFKAQQVGDKEQDYFLNNNQLPVRWKFVEVCELQPLKNPSDGAELYSRITEYDDADSFVHTLRLMASQLLNETINDSFQTSF